MLTAPDSWRLDVKGHRIACHESAHAIIGSELGLTIASVSIEPLAGHWEGLTTHSPASCYRKSAMVSLAGGIAERKAGFPGYDGDAHDREKVRALLVRHGKVDEYDTLRWETEALVQNNFPAICSLARVLLICRELKSNVLWYFIERAKEQNAKR
jgi:hypothetical protein